MEAARPLNRWSSRIAFYLGTVGAAVGLGSIWRFPYLAGANGGSVFMVAFLMACLVIAAPLLVAEFLLGRWSRRSPPEAAGDVAARYGCSRGWNAIGWLGALAAFVILSYYTMLAGWVLAYTWKCAAGLLSGRSHAEIAGQFQRFLSDPRQIFLWQVLFMAMVAAISMRGLNRGIEVANKIRAPGLLIMLLILVAYSLMTGEVRRGLSFAFLPDLSKLNGTTILAATGQAFYATGVGMAMMIAYGAYVPTDVPLVRSSLIITGSIILVSVLATVFVFPLVFRYGMDPAQGSELVFKVLPIVFSEMPGGRLMGTLFFTLLIFAALTPSIALMEPVVAWCEQRGMGRSRAVAVVAGSALILGLGSVWSFNYAAHWHPLGAVPMLSQMNLFSLLDFVSANILLPIGALLTSVLVGWRIWQKIPRNELPVTSPILSSGLRILLRYVCPLAIAAVMLAAVV